MRKIITFFAVILALQLQQKVFAQERGITGIVLSAENTPIEGVTVLIRGEKTGTQTGTDGKFTIRAAKGQVLEFSYIGYEGRQVKIGNENNITVSLSKLTTSMEDIVVVGYGTQKRGNVTGALSTVDVKKTLAGRPIADVGRGLQGAASGLSVTIPSGEVGSDPIIKIRGQMTSFQGTSTPLILLDNVEIPSIQIVNPNDIASITVLKDAAAASIYGAKASNGVLLITTKKGSGTSKPQISYSNNFSWQNVWKDLEMGEVNALKYTIDATERIGITTPVGAFYYVDRASYLKAVEWQKKYGGSVGPNDPTVFGRDWYVQGSSNQKMGVRTYNPYDHMIKEWAPTQQHDLTIGQTVGKTSYNIGLGLLDQSGMMKPAKKDEFTRYNASLRLSSEINKYITVRGGAMYSKRNKQYPYVTSSTTADPWLYLYRWGPLYPMGNDNNGDPIRSPVSEAAAANTANILQNYMNVSLGTTLNFTNNWKLDFDYTYTNQAETWNRPGTRYTARNSWSAPKARFDANGDPVYVDSTGKVVSASAPGAFPAFDLSNDTYTSLGANPDHIYRRVTDYNSSTINAFTTYNLNLNEDHNFKFILGINRVAATTEWQSQQVNQLTDIYNPQFNFAVGAPPIVDADKKWESQLGYFGRVNYAFKNKYLLEGNLRYDGASKFPSNLWWRWYPSVSAGWVVTNEKFMVPAQNIVSFLKLRGSWGSIGDQTVPNTLYLPLMPSGLSTWIGANGSKSVFVGTPPAIFSNITWQDIETKNFGVDMGLFQNKLNITFDLFQRNTNNMIVPSEGIPLTYGTGAPQGNFGSIRTNGWELTVELNHRFKNGVGLNFRGNISDARTRIKEYGTSTGVNSYYNGKDIGEIWGYRTDRLYQLSDFDLGSDGKPQLITLTADDVPAAYVGKKAYKLKATGGKKPVYQVFLQNSSNFFFGPGDVKFKDVNGDGVINNGSASLSDHGDLEVIGNNNSRYEYGFRLGADYKGFDFSVFFQGVGSRKVWGDGFLAIPGYNSSDGAMPAAIADNYWTPDHTDAFYPAAYNNGGSNAANNMQVQDRYLLNMSYLRLKNLTIGYTVSQNLLQKIGVNSFRVYGALENFITWDKLGGLPIDPESINGYSMWNTTNYNLGRTGMGIPAFKSVSFGIQLNF